MIECDLGFQGWIFHSLAVRCWKSHLFHVEVLVPMSVKGDLIRTYFMGDLLGKRSDIDSTGHIAKLSFYGYKRRQKQRIMRIRVTDKEIEIGISLVIFSSP